MNSRAGAMRLSTIGARRPFTHRPDPVSMPAPTTKAVFLSYAREDADATRRIADALRAAGIEVWFDQSELRGGDVWDAKIKRQIKDCALFVPVISTHTTARIEGYFRLEWLLAVERSRLMAEDAAFLVPVVVDATTEAAPRVPEKFRDVQWTRLAGGDAAEAFATQVKSLLQGEAAPEKSSEAVAAAPAVVEKKLERATRPAPVRGTPGLRVGATMLIAVAVIAVLLFQRSNRPAAEAPGRVRFIPPKPVLVGPESDDWPALSPDGKRLAFVRLANGFEHIFVLQLDGQSAPEQITKAECDHIQPAWSPDGGTLAYARARADNSKLKPSDVWGGYQGAQATDIWFWDRAKGKHELMIPTANGPRFNASGELVFVSDASGKPRIWTCDRLGNQRRPITDDPDVVIHLEPTWSPDGKHIAFRRQREKVTATLAIVDLATRTIKDVTPELVLSDPVWAPSGRYIYFTANLSSGFNLWRLPVTAAGAPSGPLEPVTFGSGRDLHASFSRDGQRLLFSILSWNSDLWAMPMDAAAGKPAGAPFPLVVSSREDTRGVWSADSRKIAFTSDRNGDMNLFVCEFNAAKRAVSPPLQVTFGPGGHYQASWNPNGRQLAYFSRQSGHENIWLVDLDESLRPAGAPRQLTHGSGADNNPAFSPDGKHIAFMSSRAGSNQLYVMNADGTDERLVMSPPVSGHYLQWLDANTIVANSKGLLVATLDGREPERRSVIGGAHITFSPAKDFVADTDHTYLLMFRPSMDTTAKTRIFRFPEPDVGMDYTVWSPDGRFMLFDRSNPQGGDIYEIRGPE